MWPLILALALPARAAPAPADPAEARLTGPLRSAWREAVTQGAGGDDRLRVVVEPAPGQDVELLAGALERAGFEVELANPVGVQVRIRPASLYALAACPGVAHVRAPRRASAKETISEGYDVVMTTDWHELGLTGEGVSVGVVDLGFKGWEDLDEHEFPLDAVANFDAVDADEDDHGTGVVEVLYDFAPDASYFLATFQTDAELCAVAQAMAELDVDVINGSVGFDNAWTLDGSSGLSQCVDQVVEGGTAWFAAAGNEHGRYRRGALTYPGDDGSIALGGEKKIWMDSLDGAVDVRFRWSETFGAAGQDIDLVVYNEDGSECGRSEETQDGDDAPYEEVVEERCDDRVYATLSAGGERADLSRLTGVLYSASGLDPDMATDGGEISIPGDAFGAVTVGAWDWAPDQLSETSSWGPTDDGRLKPDVVAPVNVSTASGGRRALDGTSAAAPHAAGLGVLWTQSADVRDPAEMKAWMQENAVDEGAVGPDEESGYGLISADSAPEKQGCGCATSRRSVGLVGLVVMGALALSRRRA